MVRRLVAVPHENLTEIWPLAAPFFDIQWHYDEPLSGDDVLKLCLEGDAQLFLIWEDEEQKALAVFCGELPVVDDRQLASIFSMSGERIGQWIGLLPEFEAWARSYGAVENIIPDARLGWARYLKDYDMTRNGDTATFRKVL